MYAESEALAKKFFDTPAVELTETEVKSLENHDVYEDLDGRYTAKGVMDDRVTVKKTETNWLVLEEHGAFYKLHEFSHNEFDDVLDEIDCYFESQEEANAWNYMDNWGRMD